MDNIKQEFRYPREDLQSLLQRTAKLEQVLDNRKDVSSWRNNVTQTFASISQQLEDINKRHNVSNQQQQQEIEKLLTQIKDVSQSHNLQLEKLTTDSKVLDAVRELANFVGRLK